MNEMWLEQPSGAGMWWVVDPAMPNDVRIAHVYRDIRNKMFAVFAGGEDHLVAVDETFMWCVATPPVYSLNGGKDVAASRR